MYKINPTSDKPESNLFSVLLLNVSKNFRNVKHVLRVAVSRRRMLLFCDCGVILSFLGAFLSVSDYIWDLLGTVTWLRPHFSPRSLSTSLSLSFSRLLCSRLFWGKAVADIAHEMLYFPLTLLEMAVKIHKYSCSSTASLCCTSQGW